MDRDLALQLIDLLDDIKTAIETIATNTTPATPDEPVTPDDPDAPAEG